MTGLPLTIYKALRPRAASANRLTYKQLCLHLATKGRKVHWRSSVLFGALGTIVVECRKRKLGALPALVVRRDTRRPGASYYPVAHKGAATRAARIAAWRGELNTISKSKYPPTI
jgi:hypothetical protein